MKNLLIEVWDTTDSKKQRVEVPADAMLNRVVAVMIDKLNLPRHGPDRQLISYTFYHKSSGRQLLDDQTLASADIHTGDVLRLQPEITARSDENPWQPPQAPDEMKSCPFCGERILAVARKCRYCEEYLDPELRATDSQPGALERLAMPVGRPPSAIAAGYLGLFSLLPFFGIIAIVVSLFALRTLNRSPELHGRGRAWFGLVMGSAMTLIYLVPFVLALIGAWDVAHGRRPRF